MRHSSTSATSGSTWQRPPEGMKQLNRIEDAATANANGAERVMISKDTAYVTFDGQIVNETIRVP